MADLSEINSESESTTVTAANQISVDKTDLPLHCPMSGASTWNSHPRVFLPIEATGKAKCPYCGTEYKLN